MEVSPGFEYESVLYSATGAGSASAAPATTAAPPVAGQSKNGDLKFGQSYTWKDGLSVTVSKGVPFKPSSSAYIEKKSPAYLQYTITIVNKTGATYDPALFHVTAQSGDTEANQIFDSSSDLGGAPSTKILNGRQSTFKVGFGVANPKDVVMEVSPGFEYDSVLYTS